MSEENRCPDELDLNEDVNPNKNYCTVCDGNTENNIWATDRAPGFPRRCILDELTYNDVYWVLLRNPKAAGDLKKITTNPTLLSLANEVKLLERPFDDAEKTAKRLNGGAPPFYTVMKGNTDGTIR
jgi:hypothetical protein